jgi:hypothetical protein
MVNEISLSRIDELSKLETLKRQYANLLFMHHYNPRCEVVAAKMAAFKAAEEFLKNIYPFVLINATNLALYIADTWPNDKIVFEQYLLWKEAEAEGEFYPNKAQVIALMTEMIDLSAEEMKTLLKRSDKYKKLGSLRSGIIESNKLLHDLMNWNI